MAFEREFVAKLILCSSRTSKMRLNAYESKEKKPKLYSFSKLDQCK
jgi:hypothetical protein